MKKMYLVVLVSALVAAPAMVLSQAAEIALPDGGVVNVIPGSAPEAAPTALWDNGPLVNSVGTGAGGADESVLQTVALSMNTLGFGHQVAFDNRVADDFTVDEPGWIIDTIDFYAYQTGSPTTSTMTAVNLQIWDGDPSAGGSVIFGDVSTNIMTATAFTNIYRVTETTGGAANRPIMVQTVDLGGLELAPGTYWLDWQTDGTLGSGPWAPPVTITGTANTGDGLQSLDDGVTWTPANDSGQGTPQQAFPFVINGDLAFTNPLEVPTVSPIGLAFLTLLLAVGAAMVLRRRATS